MRLLASRLLLFACALLAIVPATAGAATTPKVTSVAPLQLKIGERLTIKGSGFRSGKNKNTVIFKATGQRAVFVKAEKATKTRLTVKVPAKLASFLAVSGGQATATRFQLRVLAAKLSPAYTKAGASPVIAPATADATAATPVAGKAPAGAATAAVPATPGAAAPAAPAAPAPVTPVAPNCDGDSQVDAVDLDDDNDLLPDANERTIGTNVCDVDSDGDGMEDGWEYQSALQLNNRSCPNATDYPVPCPPLPDPKKLRYTDPNQPDNDVDYDGDWLTAGAEHAAWQYKIKQDASYHAITGPKGMWYSDGKQSSVDESAPNDGCLGVTVPLPFDGNGDRYEFEDKDGNTPVLAVAGVVKPEYAIYSLDTDGDGCLNDGERDEDHDFLTNVQEDSGELSGGDWWKDIMGDSPFRIAWGGTEFLDADTDGDGTVDGLDDQDFDDFLNVEEIERGVPVVDKKGRYGTDMSGLWVGAFNPCLPSIRSRTCPVAVPATNRWLPFFDDEPGAPRWPLYGVALYGAGTANPIEYPDPDFVDDPDDPNDKADMLQRPKELWSSLAPAEQTRPPLHPLPRP